MNPTVQSDFQSADTPIVSLLPVTSYDRQVLRDAIATSLAPFGGMSAFVKPGDRVLLKPNLLLGHRPNRECVTRPELVFCVAELVKEAGGHPFLGDSPAFGSAKGVAIANGYEPYLTELDIPIVNFSGKRYNTVSDQFNHLLLSKEAMDADVVINLPKVKAHVQLTMTLSVKNLFGCVPGKMKAWWHLEAGRDRLKFGKMLVETARAIAPDLTILDGIMAHAGNGPSNGDPYALNVLAAATNVFALDRALLDLLQVDLEQVPTVLASQQLGLLPEAIAFPHYSPEQLQVSDWQLPAELMPIDFALPRVVKSTFRHLYIRFIKEPMKAYAGQRQEV